MDSLNGAYLLKAVVRTLLMTSEWALAQSRVYLSVQWLLAICIHGFRECVSIHPSMTPIPTDTQGH